MGQQSGFDAEGAFLSQPSRICCTQPNKSQLITNHVLVVLSNLDTESTQTSQDSDCFSEEAMFKLA